MTETKPSSNFDQPSLMMHVIEATNFAFDPKPVDSPYQTNEEKSNRLSELLNSVAAMLGDNPVSTVSMSDEEWLQADNRLRIMMMQAMNSKLKETLRIMDEDSSFKEADFLCSLADLDQMCSKGVNKKNIDPAIKLCDKLSKALNDVPTRMFHNPGGMALLSPRLRHAIFQAFVEHFKSFLSKRKRDMR